MQETLLDLHVQRVEIKDGWLLYNDIKKLVAVEGGDLQFQLTRGGQTDHGLYIGTLQWESIELARRRDVPVPANVSAKFSLGPDGFNLEQGVMDLGRSHVDMQAHAKDLSGGEWTYRYRGWLDLLDLREAFRTPEIPLGRIDLRGEESWRAAS